MRKLWVLFGKIAWLILAVPIGVYLRSSKRTKVIIVSSDSILMVKSWLGSGKWSLPGGGLKRNEAPTTGLAREVLEETNLIIDPSKLKDIKIPAKISQSVPRNVYFYWYEHKGEQSLQERPFFDEISDLTWMPLSKLTKHNSESYVHELVRFIKKTNQ